MTQSGEPDSNRRAILKRLGAGAVALPLVTGATAGTSAAENALNHRRFEIWAADHIEIDYRFDADGPVEPVPHPEQGRGAETGPGGNDTISSLGGGRYRVRGRTGFGSDDTWRVGKVHRIVITDSRTE